MDKGNKTYYLTIRYNDSTDEIEYIDEEVVNEDKNITTCIVGNYDLSDYWDKDKTKLFTEAGICGEA